MGAHVSDVYEKVFDAISHPPVKDYVPFSWVSLAQVKREHYKALSHFYTAPGLLDHEGDYLVAIGDNDVKWSSHADVVKEIKSAENTLRLRLVTPMDRSLGKAL